MTTTVAQLAATGRGGLAYALAIPGLGCFTSLREWTPLPEYAGRTWPWLIFESLPPVREQVDPLEGSLDVEDIVVEVADVAGGVTALIKDWRARGYGYLTASIDDAAATIAVDDVSWASAGGGRAWIRQEVVSYAGTGAGTLTGCARGVLGTVAADHTVDLTLDPPRRPLVTDGPHTLIGRRAYLYLAVVDGSTEVGAATCVYRGRIAGLRTGRGLWRFEVEHISAAWHEEIGHRLPTSGIIPGYWVSGRAPRSRPGVVIYQSGILVERVTDTLDPYYHYDAFSLGAAWNAVVAGASLLLTPYLTLVGSKWHVVCGTTHATRHIGLTVIEGDTLWCLGFAPGFYEGTDDAAFDAEADDQPRLCVIDFDPEQMYDVGVPVDDPEEFVVGGFAAPPEHRWGRIVGPGGPFVYFERRLDQSFETSGPPLWVIEDDEDLVLHQVLALGTRGDPVPLTEAIARVSGHGTGYEPDDWFPVGPTAADIVATELADELAAVPATLRYLNNAVVAEPMKAWELIGPHLGLLGLFPRITTDARIGFARLTTPVEDILATVHLDGDIWSLDHATEIESRVDHAALLNEVVARYAHDYRTDEYAEPIRITWDDGISTLGRVRAVEYPLRGLRLRADGGAVISRLEMAEWIRSQVVPTHFGSFSRAATVLEVPCTWTSRQLRCGDYVRVTHDLAPDPLTGAVGVAARVGIIVGRTLSLTGREHDTLLVQLYPTIGAGIAPCARGTSWLSAAAAISTTPSSYAPAGVDDLAWLAADRLPAAVRLVQRSVTAAPATWAATVTTVSGTTVYLASRPLTAGSWPTGGVYLTLPHWDDAPDWARTYAHIAKAAAVPTLGDDDDEARGWTI